ncbi:MAG: alpha/beta fold hydrolase [Geminicoccaceae bacterium]
MDFSLKTVSVKWHMTWSWFMAPTRGVDAQSFFDQFEARGFRCHASLPYHEDLSSPDAAARLTGVGIADYVAAIGAFVDGLADEPIIVGHSLGGVIAQLLAAQHKAGHCAAQWQHQFRVLPTTPRNVSSDAS